MALGGEASGTQPPAKPASPFGGSQSTRISHVGRIEVDLDAQTRVGLDRVVCAGGLKQTTACYVSVP